MLKFKLNNGGKVYDLPLLDSKLLVEEGTVVPDGALLQAVAHLVVENMKLSRRLSRAENILEVLAKGYVPKEEEGLRLWKK